MSVAPLFHALLAMLGSHSSAEAVAAADLERELSRNTQLQTAGTQRQQEHLRETIASVQKRARLLRQKLALSLFSMTSAVAAGIVVWYVKVGIPTPSPVLAVVSASFFAWAPLGRLGWGGQSTKGDSGIEQLDQFLFHILYWLGMYFATVAAL